MKEIRVDRIPPASAAAPVVWEFLPESETRDETWVRPLKNLPVSSLAGRVVSTDVTLANGSRVPALLSNIDLADKRVNDHFLTLSVAKKRKWFHLARYHDVDAKTKGPNALARFLGLNIQEVFPITFDVSDVARGKKGCVRGQILQTPATKLSRKEIIRFAVTNAL